MEMLNLRKQFGSKYEITLDDIYNLESPELRDKIEWYYRISAKYGLFYVYNSDKIAYLCTANRIKEQIIRQFKEQVILFIEGADESILLFDKELFFSIALLAKAKKRRGRKALPENEKKTLVEAGKRYRFTGKLAQHTELEQEISSLHNRMVEV